ncbi:MAG: NAD-dependent dehydratase [Halobacteriovoraceae bacterium]|nr:NAD-dependent dehydratase [Halobacteriovoraceae bacterium]|tara:strand:+ start:4211 stop:5071 length:861 start_codon:yes stop_codon:yes gene_type:complete
MNILILGGNRFFGKKLTSLLLNDNHTVTLLNRGNLEDGFGDQITRIKCDRNDTTKMKVLLENKNFDVVYDQACFDYHQATAACEIFKSKTSRYIFTSSQSVYDEGSDLKESDFDPQKHVIENYETAESNYGEAKRQAEIAFEKYANFDVVSVRFPIVIGSDDYTQRFKFHVERVKKSLPIYFPDLDAKLSCISSDDAASALFFLAQNEYTGPLNIASPKPLQLSHMIQSIEEHTGGKANITSQKDDKNHSPYGIPADWFMDCSRAESLGFKAEDFNNWMPQVITSL